MNYISRSCLVLLVLASFLATSCGGCGSGEPEKTVAPEEPAVIEAAPDTAADEAAKKLEEATEQSRVLGSQIGFDRLTVARFLASELEGMQKEVAPPKVKQAPRPADDGTIDVGGVKRVFDSRHSELQACYERALKADQSLSGAVTLTIRIGPGGLPTLTRAQSSQLRSRAALDCMEVASKKWRFPEPEGGTVLINKPLTFRPKT